MTSLRTKLPRPTFHAQRFVLFAALSACSGGSVHDIDANLQDVAGEADTVHRVDASDAARDTSIDAAPADTGPQCFMVSPPAMCGDGVCDPGCESPVQCPADCPAPDGGVPCTTDPSVWTCNTNGTARYLCYHGRLYFDVCGAPGTCQTEPSPWPAQCHGCNACSGWNNASPAIGQPFVWSCVNNGMERARCVDTSTAGNCVMGQSNTAHCCVLDDLCVGGTCVGTPYGDNDYCPP